MATLFVAYLDEFGHIGPFIARDHPQHNTSPVFGLGGIVLPYTAVREFSAWFYALKCNLLAYEIKQAGISGYIWEKKGAALYTTKNVRLYRELRQATNRILSQVQKAGGFVLYVGLQKTPHVSLSGSKRLYATVLREAIKRLDQHCHPLGSSFLMVLDEQKETDFRASIVAEASKEMFAGTRQSCMMEPPIQAESHLFQNLQCADWICGLVGRLACFRADKAVYSDFEWAERYFGARLSKAAPTSGIRFERPRTRAAVLLPRRKGMTGTNL